MTNHQFIVSLQGAQNNFIGLIFFNGQSWVFTYRPVHTYIDTCAYE